MTVALEQVPPSSRPPLFETATLQFTTSSSSISREIPIVAVQDIMTLQQQQQQQQQQHSSYNSSNNNNSSMIVKGVGEDATQITSPTALEDEYDEDYELQSQSSSLRLSMRSLNLVDTNKKDSCDSIPSLTLPEENHSPQQAPAAPAADSPVVCLLNLPEHPTLQTHGRTPPVIKPYCLTSIPVKNKRGAWMTLKAPMPCNEQQRRLTRGSYTTEPSLPCHGTNNTNTGSHRSRRRVQFVAVHIREYSQTIGDNPSVSYGPPISLDWTFVPCEPLVLDDYEANRGKRRTLRQMMLNYYHRTNLLTYFCGATDEQVAAAQKAADRCKAQRNMTKALLGVSKLEEAWQSTKRKMSNKKKKSKESKE